MSNFEDVKTFMETFGQMVRTKPQFPDKKTMQLRYDLIKEELNELEQAVKEEGDTMIEGYELENRIAKKGVRRFLERWRKKYKKKKQHI